MAEKLKAEEKDNVEKESALTDEYGQFRFSVLWSQDNHLGNLYLSVCPFIHPCIVLLITFRVRVSLCIQDGFELTEILLTQPLSGKKPCEEYGGEMLKYQFLVCYLQILI